MVVSNVIVHVGAGGPTVWVQDTATLGTPDIGPIVVACWVHAWL